MIDTILVPLDGSALAARAIATARALALRYGARLILAHVHEPSEPIVLDDVAAVDAELQSMNRVHEQTYLERMAREAAPDGTPPTETVLLDGAVAPALAQYAAQHGVDLFVLTTHGRTGFERAWLGSTTDALSRTSSAALLVLRPEGDAPAAFSRVVVPLDGSPEGERVLPYVRELAAGEQAAVTLLRVVASDAPVSERESAAAYLDDIGAGLREQGLEINDEVLDGAAATAILQTAQQQNADLIALTAHGHGGFIELLLGSTADKVLRGADVPVLLVRGS